MIQGECVDGIGACVDVIGARVDDIGACVDDTGVGGDPGQPCGLWGYVDDTGGMC